MIGSKASYHKAFALIIICSIFIRYLKVFLSNNIYLLVIFPLLLITFLSLWQKRTPRVISKIDGVILFLFLLILSNLFMSFIRGTISSQLIFVLYIVLPFGVYLFIRKSELESNYFMNIFAIFTLVFSSVVIIEFLMYYISPALRGIGTAYLRDVVGNNNFSPPHVNYPLIGYATKPWGPLLDASASGAFSAVLFCTLFEYFKVVRYKTYKYILYISLLSVYLSGSKSAYAMVLLYFLIRSFVFVDKGNPVLALLKNITIILGSITILVLAIFIFFSGSIGEHYYHMFFEVPFLNLIDGFLHHGLHTVFGLGQETSINLIVGTGEVDLINSVFRYGVLFVFIFIFLLLYLMLKSYKIKNHFFAFFFMIILSMNHYQVAFKFPVSLLLFAAIAVWVNDRKRSKKVIYKI